VIVEGDLDRIVDVLEDDVKVVAGELVRDVAQDQVADAVPARDLEGGFVVTRASPSGELFVLEHLARVEAGQIAARGWGGEIVDAPQRSTPVEIAERAIDAESHGVATLASSDQPDLAGFVVLDGLGGESERGKKTSAGGAGQDHRVPINPRPALMTMATMPAGIATFQPMFISWS